MGYHLMKSILVALSAAVICFPGPTKTACPATVHRDIKGFGPDCRYRCNCLNNEQCDNVTGDCTNGCLHGWMGPACQYRNYATKPHDKVHQYYVNGSDEAIKAIDGDLSTCSRTGLTGKSGQSTQQWWRAEFTSKLYIVGLVINIPKTQKETFRGFSVSIGNVTGNFSLCYKHGIDSDGEVPMNIYCVTSIVGNVLEIKLAENEPPPLVLCEIEIFGGRHVSFNRRTSMETTLAYFGYWNSSYVVDGRPMLSSSENQNEQTARTCAATKDYRQNKKKIWWDVDLEQTYSIQGIRFFGRLDESPPGQYKSYSVLVRESEAHEFETIFTDSTTSDIMSYQPKSAYYTTPVPGRIVRVQKTDNILVFCEFEVLGDCPLGKCGWDCNETCMCSTQTTGLHKLEGTCPYGCTGRWSGQNGMCNINCSNTRWGSYCNKSCGQCKNRLACSVSNGTCPESCEPGWRPPFCVDECLNGTFGIDCNSTCGNCKNNNTCNKENGECKDGCQPGYNASLCVNECDQGWYGDDCKYTCGNCLNNDTCHHVTGNCPNWCDAGYQGPECVLYCENGTYGFNCSESCGNCSGSVACDHMTGQCDQGCAAGYTGMLCKTECGNRTYGDNCANACGNCLNNASCNHVNGFCEEGCEAGWRKNICTEACVSGYFGHNCSESCGKCMHADICNHVTGYCEGGCETGYRGNLCKEECGKGTYGTNCTNTCGSCFNNASCSHSDGFCKGGCEAGWQGNMCKDVCGNGTYGLDCKSTCGNCAESNQCNHITGVCPRGCTAGYEGKLCSPEATEITSTPTATIVGLIVGIVSAVTMVVAAIFIHRRRCRRKPTEDLSSDDNAFPNHLALCSNDSTMTDTPTMAPASIYYNNQNSDISISISRLRNICYAAKVNCTELFAEFEQPVVKLDAKFQRKIKKRLTESYSTSLPYGIKDDASEAKDAKYKSKNRYKDMLPYNKNRVILPEIPSVLNSTYINASYIDGYKNTRKYIAAQGALEATVDDIWRMVWSERICVIVMLTNCYEQGRLKCFKYWSDEGPQSYGEIFTEVITLEEYSDFKIRTFNCSKANSGKQRKILQFHYTAWSDKDVPDTALSLVQFWRTVRQHAKAKMLPWLIHCSAGVGRTGTFIALDYLYEQGLAEGEHIVAALFVRHGVCPEHKKKSVTDNLIKLHTKGQYVYLHDVAAEVVDPIGSVCKTEEFREVYQEIITNSGTRTGALYDVYKKVCEATEKAKQSEEGVVYSNITDEQNADAKLSENLHKSRNLAIIPADIHRPRLGMVVEGRNDFINAVYIPTFRQKDRMILTQVPLQDTAVDFVRMVWEYNINTVVLLEETVTEIDKYWPSNSRTKVIGPFEAELIIEKKENCYTYRTFRYTFGGRHEQKEVRQFHFSQWPCNNKIPVNTETVLRLISDIELVSQTTSSGPMVIQCNDGAKKCGLICVLCSVLERMKSDREVAIAETVRQIRLRRSQVIDNLEQYKFCYNTVQDYLESYDVYANVM